MIISRVESKLDENKFIKFASNLYKGDEYWIRPLDKDISNVFKPETNKAFKKGEVSRWIIEEDGEVLGRIAAFYQKNNMKGDLNVGGCGFFECINNQKTANLLFDTAKEWLIEKGYNSMDGPINFGERDKWGGCLVEGFQIEPNYQQNYGKNYYQSLFEEYGFKLLFKQFTYLKKTRTPLSERLAEKAAMAMKDPNYNFVFHATDENKEQIIDYIKVKNIENIDVVSDENMKREILSNSIFAVCKSGTVSLQVCNANVPSIIIYKLNFINFMIFKLLVNVKFANIINIINNREVIPELLQNECNAKEIYNSVVYMLKNPDIRKKQLEDCNQTLKGIRSKTSSSSEVASILSNSLIG